MNSRLPGFKIPHPALRATFSRREKGKYSKLTVYSRWNVSGLYLSSLYRTGSDPALVRAEISEVSPYAERSPGIPQHPQAEPQRLGTCRLSWRSEIGP